ncbi:hypothetical protein [Neptunomonas japonica]|uniref:Uncharacterized protein n=1 Tax=Neptunomonas japonica JAMM 1380 TaxID=1441457 RepID=A0A7R6PM36_9GAMM|nr:hypothetical protein [Neptunomonas japonica]BBB28947.1 hypothetical protein NEJAP_0990 [Neptunomonas japonica JAMM 1380]
MKQRWLLGLALLAQASQAQDLIVSESSLIAYEVVTPRGYAEGVDNGKTAYYRKKRGVFDTEPMYEVAYINKPSDLPPPTVIAPAPLPLVREYRAGKVLSKSDLKGEDAVFQRIYDDKKAEKCLWEPESCELAKGAQQRRQFMVPKP